MRAITCRFVYQAVLDRRATKLFEHCSSLISDQIYDGRFFDPTTTAAIGAVQVRSPAFSRLLPPSPSFSDLPLATSRTRRSRRSTSWRC